MYDESQHICIIINNFTEIGIIIELLYYSNFLVSVITQMSWYLIWGYLMTHVLFNLETKFCELTQSSVHCAVSGLDSVNNK